VTFDLLPVRFEFTAQDALHFAPGMAGNMLRGAFGMALRNVASPQDYARIFEPAGTGPSGLADRPRPFVFRVSHLDSQTIAAGEKFHISVNLFDALPSRDGDGALPIFTRTFESLGAAGLGRTQARAELINTVPAVPISIPLDGPASPTTHLTVEFKTPTELKRDGRVVDQPNFAILFARIRDRISTLRSLYGPGPLDIDFRAIGERAAQIQITRCDLQHSGALRRSSRSGQTHGIGGFTGITEYQGDLTEFLPYLEAARYTGVGRHCVWGNGEIMIQ
jgi:hypothetical protein